MTTAISNPELLAKLEAMKANAMANGSAMLEAAPADMVKPLTFFQKAKAAVSGAVKTIIEYIPRGIMMSGALLAGSYVLGTVIPGADLLGASSLNSVGALAGRMALSLTLGSIISGSAGAYASYKQATAENNAALMAQEQRLKHCQSDIPERQLALNSAYAPPLNLPMFKPGKAPNQPSLPG